MAKKVIGIILIVVSALALIGLLFAQNLSNPITIVVIALLIAAGILLIVYDGGANLNYYVGYKRRNTQNVFVWVLFIPFLFCTLLMSFSTGKVLAYSDNTTEVFIQILGLCLYLLPAITLGVLVTNYFRPYQACKKHIPDYKSLIEENLKDNNNFVPCSQDGSVMANDNFIFFRYQYCLIPFNMIESYRYSNPLKIEPDVFIKLINGKTILIVNKNFDDIKNVIDAHKSIQ